MITTRTQAVPFVDLDRQHEPIREELEAAVLRSVERGDFILGEAVSTFEAEFADYLGVEYAVGVGSGTAAITLALLAAGIGPGDEVIVPAHTYIASALAVHHAGAVPVLCDVEEATGLIDFDSAASVVGPRTAAVLVVHLYGQVVDPGVAERFADRRGIALLEDAAQAHGACWEGRRTGSFGLASAFSFYPSKNLGAFGDGGLIATSDDSVAAAATRLRNLGQERKGEHEVIGFNERLDTLQAAVLRAKLPHLDRWNADRRQAAEAYRERIPAGAEILPVRPGAEDIFHLFPVRVAKRDCVAAALGREEIGTGVHYSPAVHLQPPFAEARRAGDVSVSQRWGETELSLPMFPGLTSEEVGRVCDVLSEALEEAA